MNLVCRRAEMRLSSPVKPSAPFAALTTSASVSHARTRSIGGGLSALLLRRFVKRCEKLLAEFAIALGHEPQYFAAQIRPATNDDWSTFSLHPFHFFPAFSGSFGVGCVSGFPCASKEFTSTLGIGIPQHIGGACLNTGAARLVFETAGLVGERGDEGNGDGALLRCFGVSFFSIGFRFLCLSRQTKAENERQCENTQGKMHSPLLF